MNVLVDTSVWSLALRERSVDTIPESRELSDLIREGRVLMIGGIRQAVLSGVREVAQFKKLREALDAFPDISLNESDYIEAARCFNICREQEVTGSKTDFLICAVAMRLQVPVLTTNTEFHTFARLLNFKVHSPR